MLQSFAEDSLWRQW